VTGMRIAICTDTYLPQTNGVVVVIQRFAQELSRRGNEVAIFAPGVESKVIFEGRVRVNYFRGRSFRSYPEFVISFCTGEVVRSIREFRPDVIHVHTPFFIGLAAWWAGKKLKVPIMGSFHTPIDRYVEYLPFAVGPVRAILSFLARRYQAWFYSRGEVCTFPTRRATGFMRLPPRVPIRVQPGGVDLDRFNTRVGAAPARRSYGLGAAPVVLYAGRVGTEKRVDVLLRGFARIIDRTPEIRLVICGEGPGREELERLSVELGISSHVLFTGYVPDDLLPSVYAAADVLVQPSPVETQSLVVLEAMACGIPVIGADAGAIPEVVHSGENGLLFTAGDDRELSVRLEQLFLDGSLSGKLSRGATATARRYSWEECSHGLEGIYREVLESRRV